MIKEKIQETYRGIAALLEDGDCLKRIEQAAEWCLAALKMGNKILICGNGGSAAEAQHFAGELVGRFCREREGFSAIALTTDSSILTAIANDYSYTDVFSRQVKALGREGDILFGLSTSGTSANILRAFQEARTCKLKTILLTGAQEREIAAHSDLVLKMPSTSTPRIQEMHLIVVHLLSEIIDNDFTKSK